ncbi:MAG: methyltransferase domain-containing protein [Deltaproteobacteria bacterium]|nr:MAG: methyltransferase domain-containing protein [Deltaproteobacteria bacterium]
MADITEQMQNWMGKFGKDYTDRNALSLEEMEALYKRNYGITRSELNGRFLKGLEHSIRILEVGSNVGNQLLCLQKMGFYRLYGIELQRYAVELSRSRIKKVNIIAGSVFDIPYKDGYFDLVFTSGVLIHISPSNLEQALREIHRCSKKYIWGFEYYADRYFEIPYRGQNNLLWKADFARLYLDQFGDLELVKEERLKYLTNDNIDTMFLLRRRQ